MHFNQALKLLALVFQYDSGHSPSYHHNSSRMLQLKIGVDWPSQEV